MLATTRIAIVVRIDLIICPFKGRWRWSLFPSCFYLIAILVAAKLRAAHTATAAHARRHCESPSKCRQRRGPPYIARLLRPVRLASREYVPGKCATRRLCAGPWMCLPPSRNRLWRPACSHSTTPLSRGQSNTALGLHLPPALLVPIGQRRLDCRSPVPARLGRLFVPAFDS